MAAGAFASDTRTSQNAWLPRRTNAVTETLFMRAADLLQIDESKLRRETCAEDMQVCLNNPNLIYTARINNVILKYSQLK